MQMNVSVTPELYELVQRKVRSGLYGNASEVVRDALRRMDERAIVDGAWSELNDTLEAAVASGTKSAFGQRYNLTNQPPEWRMNSGRYWLTGSARERLGRCCEVRA